MGRGVHSFWCSQTHSLRLYRWREMTCEAAYWHSSIQWRRFCRTHRVGTSYVRRPSQPKTSRPWTSDFVNPSEYGHGVWRRRNRTGIFQRRARHEKRPSVVLLAQCRQPLQIEKLADGCAPARKQDGMEMPLHIKGGCMMALERKGNEIFPSGPVPGSLTDTFHRWRIRRDGGELLVPQESDHLLALSGTGTAQFLALEVFFALGAQSEIGGHVTCAAPSVS